jgi:SAM-dependent methyltransferase
MTAGDAEAAEFDTVAEWTAEAAIALGRDHYVPAACRGSGGPAALDWLLDRCSVSAGSRMLDVGAGVGGPSAYATEQTGVRPVVLEPQPGACRAARRLFQSEVVRADATALPFADDSFDVVWSLGVVDTVEDQTAHFTEIARCLEPAGAFGLLVYVATAEVSDEPDANHFPRPDELRTLIARAGLKVADHVPLPELGPTPTDWQAKADTVDHEVVRKHSADPVWQLAADEEKTVVRLIKEGQIRGELYLLRPR